MHGQKVVLEKVVIIVGVQFCLLTAKNVLVSLRNHVRKNRGAFLVSKDGDDYVGAASDWSQELAHDGVEYPQLALADVLEVDQGNGLPKLLQKLVESRAVCRERAPLPNLPLFYLGNPPSAILMLFFWRIPSSKSKFLAHS